MSTGNHISPIPILWSGHRDPLIARGLRVIGCQAAKVASEVASGHSTQRRRDAQGNGRVNVDSLVAMTTESRAHRKLTIGQWSVLTHLQDNAPGVFDQGDSDKVTRDFFAMR